MQISFLSLLKESQNFIRNQIAPIFLILFILAILTEALTALFVPNISSLLPLQDMVNTSIDAYGNYSIQSIRLLLEKMAPDEQKMIIGLIFSYVAKYLLATLLTTLITTAVSLALLWQLASRLPFTFKQMTTHALQLVPSILGFLLLSVPYFLAIITLSSFIAPLMIVLVIFGFLFYFMIYVLFLVCLIDSNAISVFQHINMAVKLLKKEYRLVLPVISVWLGVSLLLNYLVSVISVDEQFIVGIAGSFINLFIYFFLFTYCYRLYSLTK